MHQKNNAESLARLDSVQTNAVTVRLTRYCEKELKKAVKRNSMLDAEVRRIMSALRGNPELGIELSGNLLGFKCVHSHDNQFRVIYQYDKLRNELMVHAIGHRSSVYEELARFLRIRCHYRPQNFETNATRTTIA